MSSSDRRIMALTVRWPEKLDHKIHVYVPFSVKEDAQDLFEQHGIHYDDRGKHSHCAFFTINVEDAYLLLNVMPLADWTRGTLILSGTSYTVTPRLGFYNLITQ